MTRKRGRTSGAKDPKPMRILKQASFMVGAVATKQMP